MLNIEFIEQLYADLTEDKRQQLNTLLFSDSGQDIGCLTQAGDVSLAQVEALADFFRLPLDSFRKMPAQPLATDGGSLPEIMEVMDGITANSTRLKDEIENLQVIIQNKQKELRVQGELIETMKKKLEDMNILE